MAHKEKKQHHNKIFERLFALMIIFIIAAALVATMFFTLYISSYTVTGNSHISEQEVFCNIFRTPMQQRYFYALIRHLSGKDGDAHMIESYELNFKPDFTVDISISEKEPVCAVFDGEMYYYTDDEGFVLYESGMWQGGILIVKGMQLDMMTLYKQLQTTHSGSREYMLEIIKQLKEYEIQTNEISFDDKGAAAVKLADTQVCLGDNSNLIVKITELRNIIDSGKLNGLSGVLHLEDYDGSNQYFIYDKE